MAITIVGAGAIGGFLAARLARAGHDVNVVARGEHLAALRASGRIVLQAPDGVREEAPVRAVASAAEAPAAEILFITLKAHQLPEAAAGLAGAVTAADIVVPIQNGVPWWYFQRHGGPHDGRVVRAVDPDGALARALDPAKLVPAFAYKAAEVVAPGVVRDNRAASDQFPVGGLDDAAAPRVARLKALFASAGLAAPDGDIRRQVWNKLLGNVWANPIGALTGATVGTTLRHPATRSLALALMAEVAAVAAALGRPVSASFEDRLTRAEQVGDAKASMLQDVERGRKPEHDAILGALIELAGLTGVLVPHARALYACLDLAESRRLATQRR